MEINKVEPLCGCLAYARQVVARARENRDPDRDIARDAVRCFVDATLETLGLQAADLPRSWAGSSWPTGYAELVDRLLYGHNVDILPPEGEAIDDDDLRLLLNAVLHMKLPTGGAYGRYFERRLRSGL